MVHEAGASHAAIHHQLDRYCRSEGLSSCHTRVPSTRSRLWPAPWSTDLQALSRTPHYANDNQRMKNLRPETMALVKRVETLSGCPVEFKPDSSLTLRATLQLARNGAQAHVFKYQPTNDPIDYWVAYQAGECGQVIRWAAGQVPRWASSG